MDYPNKLTKPIEYKIQKHKKLTASSYTFSANNAHTNDLPAGWAATNYSSSPTHLPAYIPTTRLLNLTTCPNLNSSSRTAPAPQRPRPHPTPGAPCARLPYAGLASPAQPGVSAKSV